MLSVPSVRLVTYPVLPSGVTATDVGERPTGRVAVTEFESALITDTVLSATLTT